MRSICQIEIFSLLFVQHANAFPVIGKETVLFSDTLHLVGYYFPKARICIGSYELDWLALFAQGIKDYRAELRLKKQESYFVTIIHSLVQMCKIVAEELLSNYKSLIKDRK
jgi:hypothetical protein